LKEVIMADQQTEDDRKCACKGGPAAVQKSAARHRDANTGAPEPAAPQGRRINVDGLTAVPADLSHLVPRNIRDGGQALQYLRDLAASQAAGGSGVGGPAPGGGGELGVTYAGGTPSQYTSCPGLGKFDAGRGASGYTPQCNAPRGGKR
jgi:hypothetical protein